jgi:hypothetical protein
MQRIRNIAEFFWKLRTRMRFGGLSRAPLELLRFELRAESAECEWVARASDPWDSDLVAEIGERNAALQALLDAIALRQILFSAIPEIREAKFRVYRKRSSDMHELIIIGLVSREDEAPPRISSLVMRAKLYGLHFSIQDGMLEPLQLQVQNLEFAT